MLFVEACGCFCCCYCCVSLCASVLQMDVCSLSLLLFVVSYCTVSRCFLCLLVILFCCCFLFGVCRKVIFFTVDICCWLFGCSLVVAVIWWCLLLEGNSDKTRPFASPGGKPYMEHKTTAQSETHKKCLKKLPRATWSFCSRKELTLPKQVRKRSDAWGGASGKKMQLR